MTEVDVGNNSAIAKIYNFFICQLGATLMLSLSTAATTDSLIETRAEAILKGINYNSLPTYIRANSTN